MLLKVGASVPAGVYTATFAGVEETNHEKWGAGLKWTFNIVVGPQRGLKAYRTTGLFPTSKNKCGLLLKAVVGRALVPGEDLDVGQYVGQPFTIIVAETPEGGTRVESAIKETGATTAAAPVTAAERLKAAQDAMAAAEAEINAQLQAAADDGVTFP